MNEYIATFHTHLSAMLTFQALKCVWKVATYSFMPFSPA